MSYGLHEYTVEARATRMCILILKNEFRKSGFTFFHDPLFIIFFELYCNVDFRKENTRVADDIWEVSWYKRNYEQSTL